jgi:hypothetical protein
MGNIVGEPFDEFVNNQIETRQSNQFGGYDILRTDDQLKYLNNRNAWVKLASSVDVQNEVTVKTPTTPTSFLDAQNSGYTLGSRFSTTPSQSPTTIPFAPGVEVEYIKSPLRRTGIQNLREFFGSKFAEKAVLFNTLSSYNNINSPLSSSRAGISNNTDLWNDSFAYGIGGTDYGIQPPPGIISATVDSLNRGSIRKANVVLKVHNKFQFDIIELLYLRLGFTMMLEWGWDKYLDNETGTIQQVGNTIIEEMWFTTNDISQLKMLNNIQEKREKYNGNYDGFFGKVSNFTWSFNPDGSYDISIDLITIGDVIESLKVNTFAKTTFTPTVSSKNTEEVFEKLGDAIGVTSESKILKAATTSVIGEYLYKKLEELNNKGTEITGGGGLMLKDSVTSSLLYFSLDVNSSNTKNQYYVRLGEFLAQLQNLVVPLIQNGDNETNPQVVINSNDFNYITYYPNQTPLDPRVCIFKPLIDIKGITFPSYLSDLDEYVLFHNLGDKNQIVGYLMNLYINIEYLSGLIISNEGPNTELSLFKFLQQLCNDVNNSLGSVNKLEPVIKDDYNVTIIDQTLSLPPSPSTPIEIYGYNPQNQTSNFLKDIKFVSKLTPEFASMITIGATAAGSNTSEIDGTAFEKWNTGLIDRFSKKILEPASPISGSNIDPDTAELEREFSQYPEVGIVVKAIRGFFGLNTPEGARVVTEPKYGLRGERLTFDQFKKIASARKKFNAENQIYTSNDLETLVGTNYVAYLVNAFSGEVTEIIIQNTPTAIPRPLTVPLSNSRYLKFDDNFITQGKGVYKNYINILNQERFRATQVPSSEIGFIPLSFDLLLDGISGIKIYNELNINNEFLPSNYPNSLKFIITKVNHSITGNNWETSLSTISVPITEPYESKVLPPASNNIGSQINGTTPNITGPQPDNRSSFLILDGRNNRDIITLDSLLLELDPVARPAFRKFFEILTERYSGYKAIVNDVRRTWENSWNLKNNPQNPNYSPKNAEPGRSLHNYGLAIDINIETPASTTKRTLLKKNKTPWIEEGIDKVAKEANLRWGGDFTGYIDCVHFDYYYDTNKAYNQVIAQSGVKLPLSPNSVKSIDNLINQDKIKLA